MNNTEKQFIEILSKAIREDKDIKKYNDVNWTNLANMAFGHKVEGIIYSAIGNESNPMEMDKNIIEELKATAFYTEIDQARKMSYLDNVFKKFNDNNIDVLAVKGVVLKSIYPEQGQRSMKDVDILIHKEDIENVKEMLISIGYELQDKCNKFILKFFHRLYPTIVVHWSFIEGKEIDASIWNSAIKDKIIGTEIKTLGYEDFILQLCCNMADHMNESVLGLRQLIDLVLFIESYKDSINWISFKKKIEEHGIEKFTLIMFYLCSKLFYMEIPKGIFDNNIVSDKYVDLLIEDIIIDRVYGRSEDYKSLGVAISNDDNAEGSDYKNVTGVSSDNNETKICDYTDRYKIVKIIGDVKDIFKNRLKEDYGFIDNINFIFREIKIYRKRNEIIKWLEI